MATDTVANQQKEEDAAMSSVHAPIVSITKEQVGRSADRYSTKCLKHADTLPKDFVQEVLEEEGDQLAQEQFEALRRRVERRSKWIVRRVKVDRTQTPQQLILNIDRQRYINQDVLSTMPMGGLEEVNVVFIPLGKFTNVDDFDKLLAAKGLQADPAAQAQANIDDPTFADTHPNGTQWRDDKGHACYLTFSGSDDGERLVSVSRDGIDWSSRWWFAGVRK